MSPPAKEMVVENENAMETRYNGVRNSVPVNREEVADVDDVAKKGRAKYSKGHSKSWTVKLLRTRGERSARNKCSG